MTTEDKWQVFKANLQSVEFVRELVDNPADTLKKIGLTDPSFVAMITDLVNQFNNDKLQNPGARAIGSPTQGEPGTKFYPI